MLGFPTAYAVGYLVAAALRLFLFFLLGFLLCRLLLHSFLLHDGESSRDLGFQLVELHGKDRLLRIENHVEGTLQLIQVATDGFAHSPLDAIAIHRRAKCAGHGEADTRTA